MSLSNLKPETFIILLGLFPIFFISGPFLSDLFVVVIDFFFLFYLFNLQKDEKNKFLNIFRFEIYILLFFWSFSILSSINSEFILNSLFKSFFHIRFYIFALSVVFFFKNYFQNKKLLKIFHKLIVVTLILIITSMYFEILIKLLYNKEIINFVFNEYQLYRYSGLFFEEQIIGSFIIKVLVVYSLVLYHLKNYSSLNLFLLLIGIVTVFVSGERMATLLSVLYFSFYFLFTFEKKNFKKIVSLAIFFSLIIIAVFHFNKNLNARYYYFYHYLKDMVINKKSLSDSAPNYNYFDLFKSGYYVWTHEKLLGVGVRNYRNVCKKTLYEYHGSHIADKSCDIHPHNIYSELLAETGIIGIIFFLSFIVVLIFNTVKHDKLDLKDKFIVTLCIIWIFWPIASTGSYFNNYNSSIIWYLLGFVLYSREINEEI